MPEEEEGVTERSKVKEGEEEVEMKIVSREEEIWRWGREGGRGEGRRREGGEGGREGGEKGGHT